MEVLENFSRRGCESVCKATIMIHECKAERVRSKNNYSSKFLQVSRCRDSRCRDLGKKDSRPFCLSDSFQLVVHYYVSVDGMRQQEGPLKIMKYDKYRTGWEYDTWPRSSKYLEFGQPNVCQSDSINCGIE